MRKLVARALRRAVGADLPREVRRAFHRDFGIVARALPDWQVLPQPCYDHGEHPEGYVAFECRFAASHLRRAHDVAALLDIGSYRPFVLGLTSAYDVTSLDVRPRRAVSGRDPFPTGERILTGDARRIPAPDNSCDAVVTLSSVEHFGLGRYGDDLDPAADVTAVAEMIRVLRPGGLLILTTTATRGPRTVMFNAHRIYRVEDVAALTRGLEEVEIRFFSHRHGPCDASTVTDVRGEWDVLCGCWRKPGADCPGVAP